MKIILKFIDPNPKAQPNEKAQVQINEDPNH